MGLLDLIQAELVQALDATRVTIIDNSWQHAGHAAMKDLAPEATHLHITVVSDRFKGVPLMDQHRLVHAALKHRMGNPIHALEVKTLSADPSPCA